MRIHLPFLLPALLVLPGAGLGCGTGGDSAGASPVFFVVRGISNRHSSSPVPPYSTSSEIEVVVDVGCRSKEPVRFDQLQSVFYAGRSPVSAVTHVLTERNTIMAYYTQEGQTAPPNIAPEAVFEIRYGEATRFVLASANANFGLFTPETKRKVVVMLKRQGQTAYGPFDIALP